MEKDLFSSQRDRDQIHCVIKVILASSEETAAVSIDCPEFHGKQRFHWKRRGSGAEEIFRNSVHTLHPKDSPFTAMADAKRETAVYFWERQLLQFFLKKGFPVTAQARKNIGLMAKKIAESFDGNYGFPAGILVEADILPAESIEHCDWEGARERIMGHWPTDSSHQKTDKK